MAQDDLAPGMLLAAPSLHDGNFEQSVVLLGRAGDEGALGWVVNGRELMSMRELLITSDLVPRGVTIPDDPAFDRPACVGGPVAPASGWLIYQRNATPMPGEIALGDLGVTGELAAFHQLIAQQGPSRFRLVLGCAGWAPGQLESEIGAAAWLPTPIDVDLVFAHERDGSWDEAYRRLVGAGPAVFTNRRGSA